MPLHLIASLMIFLLVPIAAQAQQVEQTGSVGQLLNRVDQPSAWQAPSNFNAAAQQQQGQGYQMSNPSNMGSFSGNPTTSVTPGWQAPQYPSQMQVQQMQQAPAQAPTGFQGMNQGSFGNGQYAQPQELMQVNGQPTLRALLPGLFNRAQAQAAQSQSAQSQGQMQSPPGNPFTMQNMMKAFMGGGDAPKDPQQALSQAREDLQTARDQYSQARGDEGSVRGTREKDSKQSYAESARYHAQAAREAAERAYNCAQSSGSSAVNDIASQARAAADGAQASADRATSNASGGGW